MKLINLLLFTITSILIIGCNNSNADENNLKVTQTIQAKQIVKNEDIVKTVSQEIEKGTLIFFLNPNGRPCKMQDKIFKENSEIINKYVDIKYVPTTDPKSRNQFNKYGIRSLPSLILLNSNGEISKRFSPGIQQMNTLLSAFNSAK
ncbi:MAG: hypothetical protein H8E71_02085 [Candidatus Marinimicrobia bacterium]|nr:hypothetical protein [Candidatus Neomarinimicrobiota bacterium]MBL7109389.1 hypothetical protein [Candidatus Neomarinimicrobiota bacterium]